MNIFKIAGILLIVTQITFALITRDVDVIRHYVVGALTIVVFLFDEIVDEEDDFAP